MVLKLHLTQKPYPYPEKDKLPLEIWGAISFSYGNAILLNHEWDIASVMEFFEENAQFLLTDIFPYNNNISIAEEDNNLYRVQIKKFLDADDDDGLDAWFDSLNQYFKKHRFHLRGTDTNNYFIGLKSSGLGEISYEENGEYISYYFDMTLFIRNVENEIQRIKAEVKGMYITLYAGIDAFLKDEYNSNFSYEDFGLPIPLLKEIEKWHQAYYPMINMDEIERTLYKQEIEKLDNDGIELANKITDHLEGTVKVKYYSVGKQRFSSVCRST